MGHYNRNQQTGFRNTDENWGLNPSREREEMYQNNRKYYREHYHDPRNPSYPAPYAKDLWEQEELTGRPYGNYDAPAYRIKRKEFGHGESQNMNPGLMDNYGRESFRGFGSDPRMGRDYEQNIGYRESYNKLDTQRGPREGSEPAQSRREEAGTNKGKGPRSYRRTDDRILEDINDYMCDNPYLDASDIHVDVKNGEVTLTGTVNDRKEKRLAEDIGEAVSGVENVENRLRVKVRGI